MSKIIRRISATGIYGRFDIEHSFVPDVNILYGKNGTGKTTLLHILANISNKDYLRFVFLPFQTIEVQIDNTDEHIFLQTTETESDRIITVKENEAVVHEFSVKDERNKFLEEERIAATASTVQSSIRREADLARRSLPAAYFPAFRTMIEAWATSRSQGNSDLYPRINRATGLSRRLFGNFVPWINYPSPSDIERGIIDEISIADADLGRNDQKLFSQAFLEIFGALYKEYPETEENPDAILESIQQLFRQFEDPLSRSGRDLEGVFVSLSQQVRSFRFKEGSERIVVPILNVYQRLLHERSERQELVFANVNRYLTSVNGFLEGKTLIIDRDTTKRRRLGPDYYQEARYAYYASVKVKFSDENFTDLQVLSSGERQIATMIYSATHMSSQEIVLIDEPEISLHVDWQRLLLHKMAEQLQERQIITCTHSPAIGGSYSKKVTKLSIYPTNKVFVEDDEALDQEEIEDGTMES